MTIRDEFADFERTFPPRNGETQAVDPTAFAGAVASELGVPVPDALRRFWRALGSGYFGRRELYFFGERASESHSLIEWNRRDFWTGINRPPSEGGTVFFAETCFGEQLGFRYDGNLCKVLLFVVDTFETFLIAEGFEELFLRVLASRDGIFDPALTDALVDRLGLVPRGMHYAPIVSPLIGGSSRPENFQVETPNVHFRTAIATYEAVRALPEGTSVEGIDVEFKD